MSQEAKKIDNLSLGCSRLLCWSGRGSYPMSCLDTTPSVIVLHFGIRASIELFAGIVSQRSVIIEKTAVS